MQEDFIILVAASPIGSTANKIWNKLQQKKAHWKEQVRAQCGLRNAGSPATIPLGSPTTIPLEQQAQHQHSFEKDSVSQSSRSTFNHVQFFSQLAMLIVANVRRQCWILSGLRRVLLLRHQKPIRPVGKFFVAKALISFTSYQSIILSMFEQMDMVSDYAVIITTVGISGVLIAPCTKKKARIGRRKMPPRAFRII